jgi:hypothetical protein
VNKKPPKGIYFVAIAFFVGGVICMAELLNVILTIAPGAAVADVRNDAVPDGSCRGDAGRRLALLLRTADLPQPFLLVPPMIASCVYLRLPRFRAACRKFRDS